MQPVVALDFDGVIAHYFGWDGVGKPGKPIPGVSEMLNKLKEEGWKIIIFSARACHEIEEYMKKHGLPYHEINKNSDMVTGNPNKPLCRLLVDDRAIKFDGDWANAYNKIIGFQTWWEQHHNLGQDNL